ncbi:MAG: SBBP repeat-containing protein [Phycisphaerales bacterium]|nr:SBBP repeat-containing protein [Phycisphaerales bacterium]
MTVKTPAFIVGLVLMAGILSQAASGSPQHDPGAALSSLRGVHFVPNQGQWEDAVLYGFKSRGVDIAFDESSLTMHLHRGSTHSERRVAAAVEEFGPFWCESRRQGWSWPQAHCWSGASILDSGWTEVASDTEATETLTLTVSFPSSNSSRPRGINPQAGRFNYFIGDDQSRWASDVPSYGTIVYEGIYDGTDLHVMGSDGILKYEFHSAPGADHEQIRIRYDGIESLSIDGDGGLRIQTAFGTLRDNAPVVWQTIGGRREYLPSRFQILDTQTYTIELLAEPDPAHPVIIDPELDWMIYLGGSDWEEGAGVAVDGDGNALVTGRTISTDFSGRNNSFHGWKDAFVLKVSPSGQLLWMTYLGGTAGEWGRGIAVDADGNALVTGRTASTDFAGRNNAFHGGDRDAFALKVSSTGQLQWMTYLGGSAEEWGEGIGVDGAGNALVTGWTESTDFAGRNNSFQGGDRDAFALKVSPSGQLQWMTYLGGSAWDLGVGIAVDGDSNALVTGRTLSTDFAGRNNSPFSAGPHYYYTDAFVLKVSPSGQLQWMTYLGGSDSDSGRGIAMDADGNALVTGSTESTDFTGRNNSIHGRRDAFALKVSSSGQIEWMTYLGGNGNDGGGGIVVDADGNALVTGSTGSTNFTGRNNRRHGGTTDAFALKVSSTGQIEWMTYLGGSDRDTGSGIALDGDGNALVTGWTLSTNFVGRNNSFQGGLMDAFLLKLAPDPGCPADLNGDGVVDADDFFLFLQLFAAGDPRADFNGDGVIDANDFFAFLAAFAAFAPGC